jgi:aspartyl-tRNA synthetase|tara:strand:+ start:11936 stop:13669 length:1734 start_codon:yes stop_codon:yes gene_type:complete
MHRTHTCGELRTNHIGTQVTLSGWVQRRTDFGALTFIDLRDRYGITQLSFNEEYNKELNEKARSLGREFVIKVHGEVIERSSKNDKIPTGHIEIKVTDFEILNASLTPPFTIEDDTDGGEEIRLKYRYLDLRRNAIQNKLILRSKLNKAVRDYLNNAGFIDVETPVLIKSTPEGARDFVVPSRMNEGQYYALPQSPQTFKQLLMVSGLDKYYQIVKCFRDEDFRADRQPEFTQIDCEMSFVEREDILSTFEGMIRDVFQSVKRIDLGQIPILTYDDAMQRFGSDKPDMRFGMELVDLDDVAKGNGFSIFDNAESIVAINVKGGNTYTRKELDAFTDWVKRPQIGALGLIYCRVNEDGSLKSSVDKFFDETKLKLWADQCASETGDLILVLNGKTEKVRKQMNELRLHVGELQGLRPKDKFAACWVVDFPLVEYDEESGKWHAMHHPFTSPIPADRDKMQSDPGAVKANAYDMAINGMEVGGGSIRIHDKQLQKRMFDLLGFTEEEAQEQFGFLMNAFEYGAPPHGGIAFGLDRLTAILAGTDSIRDVIAFPKNNMGRDIMIDAPAPLNADQKKELGM